jgi:hypothetical protein
MTTLNPPPDEPTAAHMLGVLAAIVIAFALGFATHALFFK